MKGDVHSVLVAQHLVAGNTTGKVLLYGTSDPVVNLGEYVLTTLAAQRYGISATFLIYENGSREFVNQSLFDSEYVAPRLDNWQNAVTRWIGMETQIKGLVELVVKPTGLWNKPLYEIVCEMVALRPKDRMVVLRTPSSALYSDSSDARTSRLTLGDWHNDGAWMGGAMIHYCLRVFSEQTSNIVHLAPYNEKGRVYEVYAGSSARFILAPWLGLIPPNCKKKWGASFRPECFGTLLEKYWSEEYWQKSKGRLTKSIFEDRQNRKITVEVYASGFDW